MSQILLLSGWDVAVVFLLGSLAGIAIRQAVACIFPPCRCNRRRNRG